MSLTPLVTMAAAEAAAAGINPWFVGGGIFAAAR